MKCDQVREVLAEHLLGTLDEITDAAVRKHLRGCGGCRQEEAALAEGIGTIARAHEAEPPKELASVVMGALEGEWSAERAEDSDSKVVADSKRGPRGLGRVAAWAGAAAAIALIAVALSAAFVAHRHEIALRAQAASFHAEAAKYEKLLGTLGGENVRVGSFHALGSQPVDASVVIYDSDKGQNWVMVLVQAPGLEGQGHVTLTSASGKSLSLHPFQFASGGEASTFWVTSSSLKDFQGATLYGPDGKMLAQTTVS